MTLSKYQCVACQASAWTTYSTYWECQGCKHRFPCEQGMPRLYLEESLGREDLALRDYFYNGFLGAWYQHVMPFLVLPARPAKTNWKGWAVYFFVIAALAIAVGALINRLFLATDRHAFGWLEYGSSLLLIASGYFFYRHPYLFSLLLVAVPVKISLLLKRFQPVKNFAEIHGELLEQLWKREGRLQVLDISTGTCNSLYRHGWMKLNADYTGLDLSETMLAQGQEFMSRAQVPVDFVLADAAKLPFNAETFDVVLNYGALNGYADAAAALAEMARVAKPGAIILFLDEQLYESASAIETFYFKQVLSSHNVIHRCPTELLPPSLKQATVHQVYQFYYICTAVKE